MRPGGIHPPGKGPAPRPTGAGGKPAKQTASKLPLPRAVKKGETGTNPAAKTQTGARPAVGGAPAGSKSTGLRAPVSNSGDSAIKKKAGGSSATLGALKSASGSDRKKDRAAAGGQGGRRRTAKFSLALKFIIPVCVLLALLIVGWGTVVSGRVEAMQFNEIKKNGASGVKLLADLGRSIFKDRESGPDWLALKGWVSSAEYATLKKNAGVTGEAAPSAKQNQEILWKASILRRLTFYGNPDASNEVLAAYISDTSNNFVAGSDEFKGEINTDTVSWLQGDFQGVDMGGTQVTLAPVEVRAVVVKRPNLPAIKACQFDAPINSDNGMEVGKAILVLRADVIEIERDKLRDLMLGIGLGALLLAIVVCALIASTVTAPVKTLIKDMEIVSGGNLEHKTRAHSQDEIGVMAQGFNEMTAKLLEAQKAEQEAQRLENELDMAREIQHRLLPPTVPHVKGFDMEACYRPAKEVGGDYYDFFPIDKQHLGIIVADVSGKSIPGAMQMATTRTVLRFVAAGNTSAADTLAKTNAIVAADIKRGMFVTAFYVVLDALNKTLVCASAGHNPMVLARASGEIELINPNGIALGFDKGPIFLRTIKEQTVQIGSGDRVVLYTDGVVEAMNVKNEEYTDDRFYDFSKKFRSQSSADYVNRLLADLEAHKGKAEQHDDITIVTFKVE